MFTSQRGLWLTQSSTHWKVWLHVVCNVFITAHMSCVVSHLLPLAHSLFPGLSLEDIRALFLALRWLNKEALSILPLLDLRSSAADAHTLLQQISPILFYDTKITFLHRVINASAQRPPDQAPPEIKLNPLEVITPSESVVMTTMTG